MSVIRYFSVFILLIVLIGCETNGTGTKVGLIAGEESIAVVNNKKLSLNRFQARLQRFLEQYKEFVLTDENSLLEIKEVVLKRMIEQELIEQEATRKGIQVTDGELENEFQQVLSPYPHANFERFLEAKNIDREVWKQELYHYLLQKKLIEQEVQASITVTKREIVEYYKKNRRRFIQKRAFRVRNITLPTLIEAESIHAQLTRGKDMVTLVKQHSIAADKSVDGDLGFIARGELPPEMENAIFRLSRKKPISEIVHSQDGYHIFYLIQTRSRRRIRLSQARDQIKKSFVEEKMDQAYLDWMLNLKKNATIHIDQAMLKREEGF